MLRTLAAQTYNALLPLLAAFYLAVGIHAVHPNFHHHPQSDVHSCSAHLLTAERSIWHAACRHEHESGHRQDLGLFTDTQLHQHHCPFCDFLACCQLLPWSAKTFSFSAAPAEQNILPYRAVFDFARPSSCFIRGPPSLFA